MKKRTTKRTPKGRTKFDLEQVRDPRGRLDVLAARALTQVIETRAPALLPLLAEHREVIHAQLNESIGPHVFDASQGFKLAEPFFPLIAQMLNSAFKVGRPLDALGGAK